MNPSFYLIALLSCGLTLVKCECGSSSTEGDQTELTKQQILDRNAAWKLSIDNALDTFFKLIERTQALEEGGDEKGETRVSFSVTDPTATVGPYDEDVTLKYETVLTNIGDDYDPATGIFTVDTPGVYYFTFFFHTKNRKFGTHAGLELQVNGDRKVKSIDQVAGGDYGDSAGNAVILDLAKGDLVKVVLTEAMCIKDEALLNTFTGFLLHPSSLPADPPAPVFPVAIFDGVTPSCRGIVAVQHMESTWGMVCGGPAFTMNAAKVVCRQAGCGAAVETFASDPPMTGKKWLNKMDCSGSESTLSECSLSAFGEYEDSCPNEANVACED